MSIKSLLTKDEFLKAEFAMTKGEGGQFYTFTKTLGETVRICKLFIYDEHEKPKNNQTLVSFAMRYDRNNVVDHVLGRLFVPEFWSVRHSEPNKLKILDFSTLKYEVVEYDEFSEFINNFYNNPTYKSELLPKFF
jgi:hypothetical protein